MEAAREGQTKIVADLLKAGANLNLENSVCNKYNIHCGRYTYMYVWNLYYNCPVCLFIQLGNSALMVAAKNGMTEVVIQLVKAGANLNLQNTVHLSSLHEI